MVMVLLVVKYGRLSWDLIFVTQKDVKSSGKCLDCGNKELAVKLTHFNVNDILFSAFINELKVSSVYRQHFLKSLVSLKYSKVNGEHSQLQPYGFVVFMLENGPLSLDYLSCEIITKYPLIYQHLDSMMSWFSTIGGAYSAMGDFYAEFAEKAGAVSIKQLFLALRLGDPNLVTRCKLYWAISLIQQKKFKVASKIVRTEYSLCKSQSNLLNDPRLVKMALGIWTKLKYEHSNYKASSRFTKFKTDM